MSKKKTNKEITESVRNKVASQYKKEIEALNEGVEKRIEIAVRNSTKPLESRIKFLESENTKLKEKNLSL